MEFEHDGGIPHLNAAAGSIIKKMHELNPMLGTRELIEITRKSMRAQGGNNPDFADIEVIDEALAIQLVRATLTKDS